MTNYRKLINEALEHIDDPEDHEQVEGAVDSVLPYGAKAWLDILQQARNEDAILEVYGEIPDYRTGGDFLQAAAYFALLADVRERL